MNENLGDALAPLYHEITELSFSMISWKIPSTPLVLLEHDEQCSFLSWAFAEVNRIQSDEIRKRSLLANADKLSSQYPFIIDMIEDHYGPLQSRLDSALERIRKACHESQAKIARLKAEFNL